MVLLVMLSSLFYLMVCPCVLSHGTTGNAQFTVLPHGMFLCVVTWYYWLCSVHCFTSWYVLVCCHMVLLVMLSSLFYLMICPCVLSHGTTGNAQFTVLPHGMFLCVVTWYYW